MNNQGETPIEEVLRRIPKDCRIDISMQWSEGGIETGFHLIPIGDHVHRAANEITALRDTVTDLRVKLAASRQETEIQKAKADKHYELGTEYFDLYTKALRGQLKEME
jgi:hypothetical protein